MATPIKDVSEKTQSTAVRRAQSGKSQQVFVDNRAQAQSQLKLHQMAQVSSQVKQLYQLQAKANGSATRTFPSFNQNLPIQLALANPIRWKPLHNISIQHKASSNKQIWMFAHNLEVLSERIIKYNKMPTTATGKEKRGRLLDLVKKTKDAHEELDVLMPLFSAVDLSNVDKAVYSKLVDIEGQLEQFGTALNHEIATLEGIHRKGPGNRPDANDETAINSLVDDTTSGRSNLLGLTGGEKTSIGSFTENQGDTWKEKREALSGIWAKQQGEFTNLTPGKGNKYGADVEYKTTDVGKSELWDQKTLYYGHTGFDGRIHHTHAKNRDDGGKGVGLLFDSTFIRRKNYEKAWLQIHETVLSGEISPDAVKETKAADPSKLRAGIYVDMTASYGSGGSENDIKWLENNLASKGAPYATVAKAKVNGHNLINILNGTVTPYKKYSNNRGWLPRGVWYEYATTGFRNVGKCRFVLNENKSEIYLSVSHYKGYTVKPAGTGAAEVSRNPFVKVV